MRAGGQNNDDITAANLVACFVVEEMFGEPFFSEQSLRNLIMFMRGPMRGPMSVFFDQCMPSFINAHKSFSAKLGASATPAEMENLAMLQGRLIKQMLEQYVFRGLENYLDTHKKCSKVWNK